MGLIKDIRDIEPISNNRFNVTKDDLIGAIKDFPLGVVIRMLEEQESQGNKANIKVFQERYNANAYNGGFDWEVSADGYDFWSNIMFNLKFGEFYNRYPEYKQYDY